MVAARAECVATRRELLGLPRVVLRKGCDLWFRVAGCSSVGGRRGQMCQNCARTWDGYGWQAATGHEAKCARRGLLWCGVVYCLCLLRY